jgi:hypothetical protein
MNNPNKNVLHRRVAGVLVSWPAERARDERERDTGGGAGQTAVGRAKWRWGVAGSTRGYQERERVQWREKHGVAMGARLRLIFK